MTAWETRQAIQAGREAMLTAAWMTGNYARAGKMPSLTSELAKLKPRGAVDPMVAATRMAGPQPTFGDVAAAWRA